MKTYVIDSAMLGADWRGGERELKAFVKILDTELGTAGEAILEEYADEDEDCGQPVPQDAWERALEVAPAVWWKGGQPHWTDKLFWLGACFDGISWARKFNTMAEAWEACERNAWMHWLVCKLDDDALCDCCIEHDLHKYPTTSGEFRNFFSFAMIMAAYERWEDK